MKLDHPQQLHPVAGVDHIVLLVGDLDAAVQRFEALGFALSPRGTHSPQMGSANHTIVFPDDYFELLAIIAETPRNAAKRATLAARGDSMTAIACRIGDAHAARSALAELGIATSEVMDFARPLPLPDGSTGTAAFAVTAFAAHEAPAGEIFMCGHKTRDMVWRPELMEHPNGARALAGIVVATATPMDTARAYARLFAEGRLVETGARVRVATGDRSAAIICMTPDAALARYAPLGRDAILRGDFAALQIAVADLAAARSCLKAEGVAFHEGIEGRSLFVSPADAGGNVMEFIEK